MFLIEGSWQINGADGKLRRSITGKQGYTALQKTSIPQQELGR